jgi:hypothetical protein
MDMKVKETSVIISAPRFGIVEILIQGTAPLVIARFSKKAELMAKMAEGSSANNKKVRNARDYDKEAEDARYRSKEKWEGFNAAALRAGMISACRLVGFKMTLAKLSTFVEADGYDVQDGIPLIRIYGKSETYTAHTRNATGVVDVRSRPMYREWAAKVRVRYDMDQFNAQAVYNLVARVGGQVGLCEGRPDSKSSAGCGFGTFEIVPDDQQKAIMKKFGIK